MPPQDSTVDPVERYLAGAAAIVQRLDRAAIAAVVRLVRETRDRGGRIFFLGCGGGAAHAAHAVNDFRLLAGIPSFTPTDNAAELTARINDAGWETAYADWLAAFAPSSNDLVFVFSVGGGSEEKKLSVNIVRALDAAQRAGARITGVVGRDGGATAKRAAACVIVPTVDEAAVTAHTEAFQSVIAHLVVTHPEVATRGTTWESRG
jgi:D-sedoheptulose 7-phosphate isomerase